MSQPALLLREVGVRYDHDAPPTLAGVSFSIAPGERTALLGFNGSGKTTLLSAVVGLVAHEGEILVAGQRLERKAVGAIRNQVGFVFNVPEDQLLFPKVVDDVAFGLLRGGQLLSDAVSTAKRVLGELGVEHLADSPLHHLSHGQKQRVALAGALATEPSLLLLDEPSAGLDPRGKRALLALLGRLDAAMLIATHDLDFAGSLCTRFIVLDQGQVVSDGSELEPVRQKWDF